MAATAVFAASTALVTLALVAGFAPHERGQRFLLAFVACGPIALLRRWPLPVLAAATVVNALAMAVGNAPLPFGIVLGLASYLAASQLPRRVSIPAMAASAAALAVALLYAALAVSTAPVAVEAVEGFPPLVAAWLPASRAGSSRTSPPVPGRRAEHRRAWRSSPSASARCCRWSPRDCRTLNSPRRCT